MQSLTQQFSRKVVRFLTSQEHRKQIISVSVVAFVGAFTLALSRAAVFSVTMEPESGSLQNNAQSIDDTTASGQKYIQFSTKTITSTEAFHTCYPDAFCDSQNNPVILSGFNMRDIGSDTYMTSYSSLAQLQKIKSKGFNLVRLAMRWEDFQPNQGTGGFDTAKFNKLRTIVNNAKSTGVYVVLDPIHGTGRGKDCTVSESHIPAWAQAYDSSGMCLERIGGINKNVKDYIQKIATEYKDESNVVAIDLANEVQSINYTDDVELLTMYNKLIGYVREIDADKILMIEPQAGERILSASAIASTITNKSNIVYSYHDYHGGVHDAAGNVKSGCQLDGYNSSGSSCSNRNSVDAGGTGYINPTKDKAVLENRIARNLNNLATPGVQLPLYIGEYNAYEGLANADQWRKDMVALFKKYKLSRTHWVFYNQGYNQGDFGHTATDWTSSTNKTPGAWRPWVDDLL